MATCSPPRRLAITIALTVLVVFLFALQIARLVQIGERRQEQLERENEQLQLLLLHLPAPEQTPGCPAVQVVCECPDYEQGWDDADYARGEIVDESNPYFNLSEEDLRSMCADLAEYGYVPDC